MTDLEKPEFNSGLITALALFVAHERDVHNKAIDLNLYASTDHLYDLTIPENTKWKISKELEHDILQFKSDALSNRNNNNITKEQIKEFYDRAKKLLKRLDEEIFGVDVEVNYW